MEVVVYKAKEGAVILNNRVIWWISIKIDNDQVLLLMSCFRISNSSALAILPSEFRSIALMNFVTSSLVTSFPRPKLLKASLIKLKISFSYKVPLLSVSYLSKILSMACLSWSSEGWELINFKIR